MPQQCSRYLVRSSTRYWHCQNYTNRYCRGGCIRCHNVTIWNVTIWSTCLTQQVRSQRCLAAVGSYWFPNCRSCVIPPRARGRCRRAQTTVRRRAGGGWANSWLICTFVSSNCTCMGTTVWPWCMFFKAVYIVPMTFFVSTKDMHSTNWVFWLLFIAVD